jgi:hypothetical protein
VILVDGSRGQVEGMSASLMNLQILLPFKSPLAHFAHIRPKGHVDLDMRSQVISSVDSLAASFPATSQTEIVVYFAPNVNSRNVLRKRLGIRKDFIALVPFALCKHVSCSMHFK